jgi:hypothetical protein
MSSSSNIMSLFSSPSVADRWFRVLLLRRFIVFFYNNDNPSGLSNGNIIEYQRKESRRDGIVIAETSKLGVSVPNL